MPGIGFPRTSSRVLIAVLSACIFLAASCKSNSGSGTDSGDGEGDPGSSGPVVYAAGGRIDSSGNVSPGYWVGGTWTALPGIGAVNAIVLDGDTVYAGGYYLSGTVKMPGYWKDGSLVPLPTGTAVDGYVNALAISGSDVYAGGYCKDASHNTLPGYWKNGTWTPLPSGEEGLVEDIAVSSSDVYACGYIYDSGEKAAYWINGGAINLLPLDSGYTQSKAFGIVASASGVYAVGYEEDGSRNSVACYWDCSPSSSCHQLPEIYAAEDSSAYRIVIEGGNTYIAGYSYDASGNHIAGCWKNGAWSPVSDPYSGEDAYACAIEVAEGNVYIGSYSENVTTGRFLPGYWKDGAWTGLSVDFGGAVNAIAVKYAAAVGPSSGSRACRMPARPRRAYRSRSLRRRCRRR